MAAALSVCEMRDLIRTGLDSRLRRKIAFVADAGNLVAKSQRKQNLSGRRQQGANLHAPQFTTEMQFP